MKCSPTAPPRRRPGGTPVPRYPPPHPPPAWPTGRRPAPTSAPAGGMAHPRPPPPTTCELARPPRTTTMPAEVPTTPIDGGPWLGDLPSRLLPRAHTHTGGWGGHLSPRLASQCRPLPVCLIPVTLWSQAKSSYHVDRARGTASVTPVTAYSPLATGNSAGPAVQLVTRVTDPLSGVATG